MLIASSSFAAAAGGATPAAQATVAAPAGASAVATTAGTEISITPPTSAMVQDPVVAPTAYEVTTCGPYALTSVQMTQVLAKDCTGDGSATTKVLKAERLRRGPDLTTTCTPAGDSWCLVVVRGTNGTLRSTPVRVGSGGVPPNPVTSVQAVALGDGHSVLLDWTPGADAVQATGVPALVVTYDVHRGDRLVATGLTSPSYVDPHCGSATRCVYRVAAVSPAGRAMANPIDAVTSGQTAPTIDDPGVGLVVPGASTLTGRLGEGVTDARPVEVTFEPLGGGVAATATAASVGDRWSVVLPGDLVADRYRITASQGGHASPTTTASIAPDAKLAGRVAGGSPDPVAVVGPGSVSLEGQAVASVVAGPVSVTDALVGSEHPASPRNRRQLATWFAAAPAERRSTTSLVEADGSGRWTSSLSDASTAAGLHVVRIVQAVPGSAPRTSYVAYVVDALATSGQPATVVPGAPAIQRVAAGVGGVQVTWTTPVSGSAPVDRYRVWAVQDPTKRCTVTVSERATNRCVVGGLRPGGRYTFRAIAHSKVGTSAASAASSSVTPKGPPAAPDPPIAVVGNGSATASWVAPAANGSPITGYVVTASPGGSTCGGGSTVTSCKVAKLVNGTTYTFTVRAKNAIGATTSAASDPVVPASLPLAPAAPDGVPADGSVRITWSAPSDNGSPITGYLVTAKPGGLTCATTTDTSCAIGQLTNGKAYTFKVAATNALGTATSKASAPVVPAAAPGVPSAVVAVPSVGGSPAAPMVTVSWKAPTSNGGTAITSYVATAVQDPTKTCTVTVTTTSTTSCTIGSLPLSRPYSFTVVAVNAMGPSIASAASAAITTPGRPGAPTGIVATGGDTTVTITWTPPANTGGTPITSYVVKQVYTSNTCTDTVGIGPDNSCTFSGLANGRMMQYTVAAVNALGTGADSLQSLYVTVGQGPSAPTNLAATPASGSATLTWDAPTSPGSKYNATTPGQLGKVTGYRVHPAGVPYGPSCYVYSYGPTPPARTCTVTGLTNGTAYQFVVSATNDANASSADSAAVSVTPATSPGVPTGLVAIAARTTAALAWTAPRDNGGSAITGYIVTFRPDSGPSLTQRFDGTATSGTFTGLSPETSYQVTIKATNVIGSSASSTAVSALWTLRPSVPVDVRVQPQAGAAVVSWAQPVSTTFPITSYTVTATDQTDAAGSTSAVVTTNPAGIGNLVVGDTYAFTVAATNVAGTSAPSAPSAAQSFALPFAPANANAFLQGYEPPAGEIEVSWSAPDTTGLATITGYVVTASPATGDPVTLVVDAGSTSASLGGLEPWAPYAVFVSAISATGTSSPALAGMITPPGPPRKPVGFTGSSSSYYLHFSYDSTGEGTDPVGNFSIVSDVGFHCWNLGNGTCDAYGSFGYTETWTLVATNAWGSTSSDPVTITPMPMPPVAPHVSSVAALGGSATVHWDQPGDPMLWDYPVDGATWPRTFVAEVVGHPEQSCAVDATQFGSTYACTIAGLDLGASYDFVVVAANEYGQATSAPTAAVVKDVPSTPSISSVQPGDGQLTVSFDPVGSSISAVRSYSATARDADGWPTSTTCSASPCVIAGLTNGSTYDVSLTATNALGGTSPASDVVRAAPAQRPFPASSAWVLGTDVSSIRLGFVVQPWLGRPFDRYAVSAVDEDDPSASTTAICPADPGVSTWGECLVTGLAAGDHYRLTVIVVGPGGRSDPLSVTDRVVPAGVPSAPTISEVASGSGSLSVHYAGAAGRGAAISGYEAHLHDLSSSQDAIVAVGQSPATISGLVDGDRYQLELRALNSQGHSDWSASSAVVVPASVPDVPKYVRVTSGDASAALSFAAPAANGSPITGYVVLVHQTVGIEPQRPADREVHLPPTLPLQVDGLVNGDQYRFTLTAVNAAGQSAANELPDVVAPLGMPGAPTVDTARVENGDGEATVTFQRGASGGAAIRSFTAIVTDLATGVVTTSSISTFFGRPQMTITGLTNGHHYGVTFTQTTVVGTSAASDPPLGLAPAGPPPTPIDVHAALRDGAITVSWSEPAVDTGAPVTGFRATALGLKRACVSSGPTSCTIVGAEGVIVDTVAVVAINRFGESDPSSPVSTEAGAGPASRIASAPTDVSVGGIGSRAVVRWSAPSDTGGGAITGYAVTLQPGGATCTTVSSLSCWIDGIDPFALYTATVVALNSAGTSAPSTPSPEGSVCGIDASPCATWLTASLSPSGVLASEVHGGLRVSWFPASLPATTRGVAAPSGRSCTAVVGRLDATGREYCTIPGDPGSFDRREVARAQVVLNGGAGGTVDTTSVHPTWWPQASLAAPTIISSSSPVVSGTIEGSATSVTVVAAPSSCDSPYDCPAAQTWVAPVTAGTFSLPLTNIADGRFTVYPDGYDLPDGAPVMVVDTLVPTPLTVGAPLGVPNTIVEPQAAVAGSAECDPSTSLTVRWFVGSSAVGAPVATSTPARSDGPGCSYLDVEPQLSDGDYTVVATMVDAAGNAASATTAATVDSVAPDLALTTPAAGATVPSGVVRFAGTSPAQRGDVATVLLSASSGTKSVVRAIPLVDGTFSTLLPLAAGTWTITLRQVDSAGNATEVARRLVVASAPSNPTIVLPAPGSRIAATTMVAGWAAPADQVQLRSGAAVVATTSADASGWWSTTVALPAETTTITATVGSAVATVPVHLGTPSSDLTIAPVGRTGWLSSSPVVGTARPGSTIMVAFDGVGQAVVVDATGTWSVPTLALAEGAHTISATDGSTTVSVDVRVDLSAPILQVLQPASTMTRTSLVSFAAPSAEADCPQANLTYYRGTTVDSGAIIGTRQVTVVGDLINDALPSHSPEGAITVSASRCDAAGNVATTTATFGYDTTAPAVTAPLSPLMPGPLTIRGTAGSAAGDQDLTVTVDGVVVTPAPSSDGTFAVVTAITEGTHHVVVSQYDDAGNAFSEEQDVTVLSIPPQLSLDLSDRMAVTELSVSGFAIGAGGPVTVSAVPDDTSLAGVTTVVDPVSNRYSIKPLSRLSSPDGWWTVTVTRTDGAGNQTRRTAHVLLDPVAPSIRLTGAFAGDAQRWFNTSQPVVTGEASSEAWRAPVQLTVLDAYGRHVASTSVKPTDGTFSVALPSLADGAYELMVGMADPIAPILFGTVPSRYLTIDRIAPALHLDRVSGPTARWCGVAGSASSDVQSVTASFLGADGALVESTQIPLDRQSGSTFCVAPSVGGTYGVILTQDDLAGNRGSSTLTRVTFDVAAPVVGVDQNSFQVRAPAAITGTAGTAPGDDASVTARLVKPSCDGPGCSWSAVVPIRGDGTWSLPLNAAPAGTWRLSSVTQGDWVDHVGTFAPSIAQASSYTVVVNDKPTAPSLLVGDATAFLRASNVAVSECPASPSIALTLAVDVYRTSAPDVRLYRVPVAVPTSTSCATVRIIDFGRVVGLPDAPSLINGAYTLIATASDAQGNVTSRSLSYTSTYTPPTPTITGVTSDGSAGLGSSAAVDASPILHGTAWSNDFDPRTVEVYLRPTSPFSGYGDSSLASLRLTAPVQPDGSWSLPLPSTVPAGALTATVHQGAGQADAPLTLTNASPTVDAVTMQAVTTPGGQRQGITVSGAVPGDRTISGGSVTVLSPTLSNSTLCPTITVVGGRWSCTAVGSFPDGDYRVAVTVTEPVAYTRCDAFAVGDGTFGCSWATLPAGQPVTSDPFTATALKGSLPVPVITAPQAGSIVPAVGVVRPVSGPVTVSGSVSSAAGDLPKVTLRIYAGSVVAGTPVIVTTTANSTTNLFSKVVTLADGTWTIQAMQADASGNKGYSSPVTVVEDSTAPAIATSWPASDGARIPSAAVYGTIVGGVGDFASGPFTEAGPRTSGTPIQAANQSTSVGTISYYAGGTTTGTPRLVDPITTNPRRLVPAPSTTFSDAPSLAAGPYTAVITAADLAGNVASKTVRFTVDASTPASQTPTISASITDSQGTTAALSGAMRVQAGAEELAITVQCPLGANACPTPGGAVTVLDNGTPVGGAVALAAGQATTTTTLHVGGGTHALTVAYGGDAVYAPATSATLATLAIDPIAPTATVVTPTAPTGAASLANLAVSRTYRAFSQRSGGQRRTDTFTCPSGPTTVVDADGTTIYSGSSSSGPPSTSVAAGTQSVTITSAAAGDCAGGTSTATLTLDASRVGSLAVADPNGAVSASGTGIAGPTFDPTSALVVGRDINLAATLAAPDNEWWLNDTSLTNIPLWILGPDGTRIAGTKQLVSFDLAGGLLRPGVWGYVPVTTRLHFVPTTAGPLSLTVVVGGDRSGFAERRTTVNLAIEPAPLPMAMSFSPAISHPGQPQSLQLLVGPQASAGQVTVPSTVGGTTTIVHPTLTCLAAGCSAPVDISGLADATSSSSAVAAFTSATTGRTYLASSPLPRTPWPATMTLAAGAGAPRGLRVTPTADGTETLDWVAPASNGSVITGYTVTSSAGPGCTAGAAGTSCAVSGLVDGTATTFSVRTVSSAGTSAPATITATPSATTTTADPNPTVAAPLGSTTRDQLVPITVTLAFDPAMASSLRRGQLELRSNPWTSANPNAGCGNGIPNAFCSGTADVTTVDLASGAVHRTLSIANTSLQAIPDASLTAAGTSRDALTPTASLTWTGSTLTLRTSVYVGGGPFDVSARFVAADETQVSSVATGDRPSALQPSPPAAVRVTGVGAPVVSVSIASAVMTGGYYGPRGGSNGSVRKLSFSTWNARNPQVGETAYVRAQADPIFTAPSDSQIGLALAEAVPTQAPVFVPSTAPLNQTTTTTATKRLGIDQSYDGTVSCTSCAIWSVRNLDPSATDPRTGGGLSAGTSTLGVVSYAPGTSSVTGGSSDEVAARLGIMAFPLSVNPWPTQLTATASLSGSTIQVLTGASWPGMAPEVQTSLGDVAVSIVLNHADTTTMIGYCFYSGVCLADDGNGETYLPATVVAIGPRIAISIDASALGSLGSNDTVTVTTNTPWGVDAASDPLPLAAPSLGVAGGSTATVTGTGAWLGATPLSPNVSSPWPFLGWSVFNGAHDFFVSLFGNGATTRFLMGLTGFLWSSALEWVATGGPFNPIGDLAIVQVARESISNAIAASRLGRLAAKAQGLGAALKTWVASKLPARVGSAMAAEAGPAARVLRAFASSVGGYTYNEFAADWVARRESAALGSVATGLGLDTASLSSIHESVTSALAAPANALDPSYTSSPSQGATMLAAFRAVAGAGNETEALTRFSGAIQRAYEGAAGDAAAATEDVGYGKGVAIMFAQNFSAAVGVTIPSSGNFNLNASTLTIATTRDPFDLAHDDPTASPGNTPTATLATCTLAGRCTTPDGLTASVLQGKVVLAGQFPSSISWAPSGAWLVLKLNLVTSQGAQGPVVWNRANIAFQGQQYDCWGIYSSLPRGSNAQGNQATLCDNIAGAQRAAGVQWPNGLWRPTGLQAWNPSPSFDPTTTYNATTQMLIDG